jgi:PKHD-type hydroxylase
MYFLAASPDLSTKEQTFATWENGFSESEIARILVQGELTSQTPGTVNANEVDAAIRQSTVSWLPNNQDNVWLYDKVGWIVRQLNGQFFNFDLTGFGEPFQYTVYTGNNDHYTWHVDKGIVNDMPRKLSLTVQLSDPSEYEGGVLELQTGNTPVPMAKTKGLVVAFPSWILHRVTPVTAGTRRSLVIWTGGPSFR